MNTNSLQQHVNEPTREINILDLVMTTTDISINGLEVTDKIVNRTRWPWFRILKETAKLISEHLTNIFNRSLETGIVPDDWKRANVTPIFKKRNKKIPDNYRPISLTSVINKTIERLLKVRITKHLNDQNLINDTQHGFREKHSCLTNLLDFFGEVNCVYDHTKAVDLVYLDFQKAFDKVPHERLMAKVEAHGIQGNCSRWIRNWLTSRTQRVVIEDHASDSTLVTSGVPQGSVLGPLLYIIYINDLDVGIISKINKFADDTKLCHRAFTERDKVTIQSDLNRLLQWVETWQMSFNIEKCPVMHVGANNRHFQHTLYAIPIEIVQQQRNLGVIVTENLKHNKQVEKNVKNSSRIHGFIARNFEYKSKNVILPLYKELVQPHLEYTVQLWFPTLRKDVNKMEKIQRKATKMIPELRSLSYESRLQRLELISLEQRRLRGQLTETFGNLNCLNNVTLDGLFERDGNVRTRNNGKKLLLRNFKKFQSMNFFPVKIAAT
ncbi:Reverse transcriptase domain [Trinorchestia longiramus]|nr:Reverse transcriptase domain [Trinorchestia longiramus]